MQLPFKVFQAVDNKDRCGYAGCSRAAMIERKRVPLCGDHFMESVRQWPSSTDDLLLTFEPQPSHSGLSSDELLAETRGDH